MNRITKIKINFISLATAIKIINRHKLMRININSEDSEIKSVARNFCRKNKFSPQDAML